MAGDGLARVYQRCCGLRAVRVLAEGRALQSVVDYEPHMIAAGEGWPKRVCTAVVVGGGGDWASW